MADAELPLALRRTRRSINTVADATSAPSSTQSQSCAAQTPRRKSKRVRFSDPGLTTTAASMSSTGLTPMVRRTSLARNTPSSRRRHSTPARSISGSGHVPPTTTASTEAPMSGEVRFMPLRQVLDGRIQRRIRRNGLSEEMNVIADEKRGIKLKIQAELDRLRAQLRERDAEIHQLQNATIVLDTDRIWELEKQIEDLQDQLDTKTVANDTRIHDWNLAAHDPFSDDPMDVDDDEHFGETTVAQLTSGTPSRRARASASFPTPPLTSPVMETRYCDPMTPSSERTEALPPPQTPTANAGVQTSFIFVAPEEKQHLQDEVASLQLEMGKLGDTLGSYTALASRLSERMATITPPTSDGESSPDSTVESQLESLLRTIADRSQALHTLTSSITSLGFPGEDAAEMLSSVAAGFRTARLELEYLTPGEISLPLTSHGAEVLDLLLTRLRSLAVQAKDDEANIDEYHSLELSLRQQLGARAEAMDALNADLTRVRDLLAQRDAQVFELEVAVDRMKGATGTYVRDIAELEKLVTRMDDDHVSALEKKDAAHDAAIVERDERINNLAEKISSSVAETEALKIKIAEMEVEMAVARRRSGSALRTRDARVVELRDEVDRVNAALRNAWETIKDMRIERDELEGMLQGEKEKGRKAVEAVREELERVVNMSREVLAESEPEKKKKKKSKDGGMQTDDGASEARVSSRRGSLLAGDLARKPPRGKKRYDSGLGLMDEDPVGA